MYVSDISPQPKTKPKFSFLFIVCIEKACPQLFLKCSTGPVSLMSLPPNVYSTMTMGIYVHVHTGGQARNGSPTHDQSFLLHTKKRDVTCVLRTLVDITTN